MLCDDDKLFLDLLDIKVRSFLRKKNISFSITRYYSGDELLQSNINQVNMIFLDVNLNDINGIELAAILRRRNADFVLVFISALLEYAPAGYEVNAIRYVMKEQLNILFESTMATALKELGYFRTQLSFEFVNGSAKIYTDSIIYIESNLHTVYFHMTGSVEKRYLYGTLNHIEKQLPINEFIRIHQSYIVNMKYFIDAKNYLALLIDNIELPISQKRFADVKKQLFLYRGKM